MSVELATRLAEKASGNLRILRSHTGSARTTETSVLFRAGERDKALEFLRRWFAEAVGDYLKICDAYFGLEDLEALRILQSTKPICRIWILTSRMHLTSLNQPWEETFRTHWRMRVSDQDPPDTTIVVVGSEDSGRSPIHDRWWLTNEAGLGLGTSFNSLGRGGTSEVRLLSQLEADAKERELEPFLRMERRDSNRERLRYTSFSL